MKFIDEAKILVRSGNGGPGAVSFRRETFEPRGGPDGGDGGRGGNVIFQVDPQLATLLDLRLRKNFSAGHGEPGGKANMSGHSGEDIILKVPPGTLIKNAAGQVLFDLNNPEEPVIFLKGGRGGKGNWFFRTSVNQAPRYCQPGEKGESAEIFLELKLIADVGIIGLPNAGKSTLISRISAARPKIAEYPFTTLVPNLGVVHGPDFRNIVVADIPGLIKGAHKGTGLGVRFLKHIERTRFFIHLIDGSDMASQDPVSAYNDINEELLAYDKAHSKDEGFFELSTRKQLVVINKIDSISSKRMASVVQAFKKLGVTPFFISAVSGVGIKDLLAKMLELLNDKEEDKEIAPKDWNIGRQL